MGNGQATGLVFGVVASAQAQMKMKPAMKMKPGMKVDKGDRRARVRPLGQPMAVSPLLRRVGRLLISPSEGGKWFSSGKGTGNHPSKVIWEIPVSKGFKSKGRGPSDRRG